MYNRFKKILTYFKNLKLYKKIIISFLSIIIIVFLIIQITTTQFKNNKQLYMENTNFDLKKIKELPKVKYTKFTKDPNINFEIFWQTFEEQSIAFNHQKNLNWAEVKKKYEPKINNNTSDEELLAIFEEMIKNLNDGHTSVMALNKTIESKMPTDLDKFMDNDNDKNNYYNFLKKQLKGPQTDKNGNMIYGYIKDSNIGYINLLEFEGYANSEDFNKDISAFRKELDFAITYIQKADALIIDLRLNSGGYDDLSINLANRFTTKKQKVYSKQFRIGGYQDFSKPINYYITPQDKQFLNKPIYVLTSNFTISAGDVATMILKTLPNVILIGETTNGSFSDMLEKKLPNGWEFTLSNERYLDINNLDLEQIGVIPDIKIEMKPQDLKNEKDLILEKAIQIIKSN